MRVKSVAWGTGIDPARSLTIGEFEQGGDYRTVRQFGTPNYLLILTVRGGGRIVSESGLTVDSKPGDILLFDPGTYHNYGSSPAVGSWSLVWCHFVPPADWDYWRNWPACWPGLRILHVSPRTAGRVGEALRIVHDADFGNGQLLGDFMLNCLQRALLYIHQDEQATAVASRDPRIEKALNFILQHPQADLSAVSVARHCGLSLSRFAHIFKEETGQPPQQFVESHRMGLARNLLRFSSLAVADVAAACGFRDPFYFSTRFRRHEGCSPRQFRESR